MKKATLIAVVLSVLFASGALGQAPPSGGATGGGAASGVAIIDLAYVFKNHAGFKQMKGELETAIQTADLEYKTRGQNFQVQAEQLKELKPGSPEFKSLETALIKEQAELNSQITLKRKQFVEQEAKMMYTVYKEILDEVTYYCQRNRVGLVLKFNGDALDMNDPQQVLAQVNKTVVYHDKAVDITPVILDRLNRRRMGQTSAGRSHPQGVPQRR